MHYGLDARVGPAPPLHGPEAYSEAALHTP